MIFLLVICWVLLMLFSLRFGFLNIFSYSALNAPTQGIDFFSLPKAFLNLLEGRSMYDSWGGAPYGPRSTWYISHPALGLVVGFWFSFFRPWVSYWLFVVFSVGLLAWSARLLSGLTADPLRKSICYLLLLCSFPVYWILFTGNIHAVTVFGFTLIITALFSLAHRRNASIGGSARACLLSGLLVSFFSKPVALLYLPILLINRATRKTTVVGLVIYGIVSLAFLQTPFVNPQKISMTERMHLALSPTYVKDHLNVYKNNFVLNRQMKDNGIHWFHMVAQSGFYWNHVDIFSLAAFTNTLAGRILPGIIYKFPLLLALTASALLGLVRDPVRRLELSLPLVMAVTLTFFLSYNTVWEYQFALLQPVVATLFLLRGESGEYRRPWAAVALGAGALMYLPTGYFLMRGHAIDDFMLTVIRADRVMPALVLYVLLMGASIAGMTRAIREKN